MAKKSKYQVSVGDKSKIIIQWNDKPENFSHEARKHIISIVSDRYSIPKENVRVEFTPIKYNDKGEVIDVSKDVINNIQDPKFQIKLFSDYINENGIEDVDFEYIKKIDSEVNSKIDYDVYDKFRKYEIEWIEWDNFLSYGQGNRLDFTQFDGLVLVNGIPGNMCGKSTITIDLISFLLFGKTQKPYTLSECFNKYINDKYFRVSGALKIDGVSYVIERIVSRAKKRSGEWGDASQEVKYYQIIGSDKEELLEFTKNNNDEHSIKTNKVIKEAIGSEKDFNMIISATGNDLDSLIDIGITERGRLLSKWIGLFPLEEKDKVAKDAYKEFEKNLKLKLYNETDLLVEIENNKKLISEYNLRLIEENDRLKQLETLIAEEQAIKDTLLSTKKAIDANILKLDVNTITNKLKDIESSANIKKLELKRDSEQLDLLSDVNFSHDAYKNLLSVDKSLSIEINNIKNEINTLKKTNKNLKESEKCPTCHRKYDGADNSKIILDNENKIDILLRKEQDVTDSFNENKRLISKMESDKSRFDVKLKLESTVQIIPVQIDNLRAEYREKKALLREYNNNKDAIDSNNKIDISLVNVNAKINSYNVEKNNKLRSVENLGRNILESDVIIEKNNIIIQQIRGEMNKVRDWKIYLEMVGKNGISKTVLKKTLPIINLEISRILDGVCEFDVDVILTDKNEVMFKIIKDGVSSNLAGASGFERTASALALRCILGNISTMPKPNFITLDEVLGKVAKENYDNMRLLYRKMAKNYQFILHISHIEDIIDWHDENITIIKNDNISSVKEITKIKKYMNE